jgi:DNA replication and repair protein RecF
LSLQTGITRLAVQGFRSYETYAWDHCENSGPPPQTIALVGPNGVGKTNLLEALSLLTPGRGLRGAALEDFQADHVSAPPWAVAATVSMPSGPLELLTQRLSLSSTRRGFKLSGFPVKTQKELHTYLYALWLTPQMDGLLSDTHSVRRRFLDRLVLGFDPSHARHVTAYEKALRERHRLFEDPSAPSSWFQGLEYVLAQEGVAITQGRLKVVAQLTTLLKAASGPFPKASLQLEGDIENQLRQKGPEATVVFFHEWLERERALHQRMGQTPWGPHKSKMQAFFQPVGTMGLPIPAEKASTGQQKILLMSLILAACQGHAEHNPLERCLLLLLDDVMAHLDALHRQAFLETIATFPFQIWMSGTDVDLLEGCGATCVFLKG